VRFKDHPASVAARDYSARADLSARYAHKLEVEIELPMLRVPELPAVAFGRSQVEAVWRVLERGV